MLFDLGWSEILLIGTVALVFIGPKDLPKAMRVAGYWMRKARTLSREFQSSIDQMIREAELEEVRQDLKKATEFDLDKEFHNTIDPTGSLSESLKSPELPNFPETEALPLPVAEGEPAKESATQQPTPLEPPPGNAAPSAPAPPEPDSTEPAIGEPETAPAVDTLPGARTRDPGPPQP
jgi:sec-independent protein translocase protein TatB